MAMEVAHDLDSAGDFSGLSSYSDTRSRSTTRSRVSALTGFDVESGEDQGINLVARGHRSMYAALAEEALLGAVTPSEPEGPLFDPDFASKPAGDHVGRWPSTSPYTFWRMESVRDAAPAQARCCVTSPPNDAKVAAASKRTCVAWWVPVAASLAMLVVLVAGWDARVWLAEAGAETHLLGRPRPEVVFGRVGAAQGCCTAPAARCFACRAGLSVEAFCAGQGRERGVVGCEEGAMCCSGRTAECLACSAGTTVRKFCAQKSHANTTGCEGGGCGFMEHGVEYTGGDLYSVGHVASAAACCTLCREAKRCTSWSWGGDSVDSVLRGRCFLKNQGKFGAKASEGFVSGLPTDQVVEFHVRAHSGACLVVDVARNVALQECRRGDPAQLWAFERRTGRLTVRDRGRAAGERCLDARGQRTGDLALRPCKAGQARQRWEYDAATGRLRTGRTCLVERGHEGAREVVHGNCQGPKGSSEWVLMTGALLELEGRQAHADDAVITRGEGVAGTDPFRVKGETANPLPFNPTSQLFCFSVMVSWGYEPALVRQQAKDRSSIFDCDGFAVYSDAMLQLGNVRSRLVDGTDLRVKKGGEFHTLLNTPVFMKVWEQVLNDAMYLSYEWTVKADCDAVFFPSRLRTVVQGAAVQRPQEGAGVFMNNCGFGLHGPIEVLSGRALETYKAGFRECDEPPQEDVFLQACLLKLGVRQVNQFSLLAEEHCRSPNWQTCQSQHVTFHPFKDHDAYRECQQRATHVGKLLTA